MSAVPASAPPQAAARCVFITGGSSGIGQALALAYAQRGWNVALVARRVEAIDAWAAAQGIPAQQVLAIAGDVTDVDSMLRAAQACIARFGLPEVVIANAGISHGIDTAERSDMEVLREIHATNVLGVAHTFHPFVAAMCARGRGTLVGIGSVAGVRGLPGHGGYSASKAAVMTYCESLRTELRAFGVAVTTIAPGYITTPLTAHDKFPKLFEIPADEFARRALPVIDRQERFAIIPWQMAILARILRLLPPALYDRAVQGRGRKARKTS